MASTWKILAALALFLTLPVGAYVTGAMVGPPSPPEHQAQLVDQDADVPAQPARKAKDRPSARPTEVVTATGTGPATVGRDQPGSKVEREKPGSKVEREKVEREKAGKRQRAEREPDATEKPTGDADSGNEPAEDPAPSESPEPTEAPETDDPEPTGSPTPTPTDEAEPEPAEPTTSVAPSDEPEDVAGR